jgi:hypothetical protein
LLCSPKVLALDLGSLVFFLDFEHHADLVAGEEHFLYVYLVGGGQTQKNEEQT